MATGRRRELVRDRSGVPIGCRGGALYRDRETVCGHSRVHAALMGARGRVAGVH